MRQDDWKRAKEILSRPYGQITLLVDGYEVTLQLQMLRGMFRNGIAVYINGQFKWKWLTTDCEERRRFIAQRDVPLMNRQEIAHYNRLPKAQQKALKDYRDRKYIRYDTHWTDWNAMVKHFEANNEDIRLKEDA